MNPPLLSHSNRSENLAETCQAIVFQIADHYLALPQTAIVRVISADLLNLPATFNLQLTLLEGIPLMVLPLNLLLAPTSSSPYPFMIIARHPDNLLAIPVSAPPMLLDIPLSKISIISTKQRQQIHNIANYIAFINHQNQVISVLLLDLRQTVLA